MQTGPTSHSFISQRLRLHYVDWGNPEAPPLILLHGGRDHCRSWDAVAEDLRKDYHVIAPDLRGHGDSQWSPDGHYSPLAHVFDLAQLILRLDLAPVSIIGHSFGGNIALRYTGLYPETVKRLVAIEGLGFAPSLEAERAATPIEQHIIDWVEEQRALAGRSPRRYASIEEGIKRMQEANTRINAEQARHLTIHGMIQNEDGSYSWKFDDYVRPLTPTDLGRTEQERLWSRIQCQTLLVYGTESWASNPLEDGRTAAFRKARVVSVRGAGHWVHHDKLDEFLAEAKSFLA